MYENLPYINVRFSFFKKDSVIDKGIIALFTVGSSCDTEMRVQNGLALLL